MMTLNSPQVVQETVVRWRRDHKIAFVPTMGCLHEGHLRLVERAKQYGQKTVVSIFVNPLQFAAGEDFEKYPRTLDDDIEKLRPYDVDLLFCPNARDLYPDGFLTRVSLTTLTDAMEGASRPGHFDGVATVCLKLFHITQADFAVFGEKDFQQLRVLQQLVSDLNLPVSLIAEPTARDKDGLALSSRNRFLTPEQREWARRIPEAIAIAQEAARTHSTATVGEVLDAARKPLAATPMGIDYLAIASARDLQPAAVSVKWQTLPAARLFVAVKAGGTRLIDNAALIPEAALEEKPLR